MRAIVVNHQSKSEPKFELGSWALSLAQSLMTNGLLAVSVEIKAALKEAFEAGVEAGRKAERAEFAPELAVITQPEPKP